MRQIVLDTETTGIEVSQDHRIIEIGAVELVNRRLTGRHFHRYINPQREVEEGAFQVHGLSNDFLSDKPLFAQIVEEFLDFVRDAQLVIHNAPFDVGFLNHEFNKLSPPRGRVEDYCSVIDTLAMARKLHPGQKNNLDALCKRYYVDNSQRDLHGGLLDAEILADVYLAMTGGQVALGLKGQSDENNSAGAQGIRRLAADRPPLLVMRPTQEEQQAHEALVAGIAKKSGGVNLWQEAPATGD